LNAGKILLSPGLRRKLEAEARSTNDARYRVRCLSVLRGADGRSQEATAAELSCSPSTVGKARRRFLAHGLAGLVDRREDNGECKADERYAATLLRVLKGRPRDFGYTRPTWTRRLLIRLMRQLTRVVISPTTIGRLMKKLRVRRGRGKPVGPCPWPEKQRRKRMKLIHTLIASLPADQACVWEDEADIDLNPKIGVDWTLPGTQRLVMTPGKNIKRYFAAAMDARTDELTWVGGRKRKNSTLFIELLDKLKTAYAGKRVIHIVLDNYTIHSSRQTRAWLAEQGEVFRLHFLPPYAPDDNRIERKLWREVHANVTVHHDAADIDTLCARVRGYMVRFNNALRESRTAI
jgi:transposase/DNA-binding CsgD family transcriptional regulator